ncbi:hypothetical protein KHA80_20780 [Anaerobacillus sp. HL2]|nr:hypothetical protein KHA80_20780 [Anaerobacillus sp. HL2]
MNNCTLSMEVMETKIVNWAKNIEDVKEGPLLRAIHMLEIFKNIHQIQLN